MVKIKNKKKTFSFTQDCKKHVNLNEMVLNVVRAPIREKEQW